MDLLRFHAHTLMSLAFVPLGAHCNGLAKSFFCNSDCQSVALAILPILSALCSCSCAHDAAPLHMCLSTTLYGSLSLLAAGNSFSFAHRAAGLRLHQRHYTGYAALAAHKIVGTDDAVAGFERNKQGPICHSQNVGTGYPLGSQARHGMFA